MPAKNPRINIVLDKKLYENVDFLAKKDGVSLSLKARDLIREALEIEEDITLGQFAEDREKLLTKKGPVAVGFEGRCFTNVPSFANRLVAKRSKRQFECGGILNSELFGFVSLLS